MENENPEKVEINQGGAAAEMDVTRSAIDNIVSQPPAPLHVQALEKPAPVDGSQPDRLPTPGSEIPDTGKIIVKGETFNPAIHKTNPDGSPRLGSKNQLLLKKEAKKSAGRKIRDAWDTITGRKPETENAPESEILLSDHEIEEKRAEDERLERQEQAENLKNHRELTQSAESSAELYFMGGMLVLGPEFLNQRDNFHPKVAAVFYEYEKRTGKSIDLPPSAALAIGLFGITRGIVEAEPKCKQRFDNISGTIRDNAGEYLKGKIPFFGKRLPAPGTSETDEES